MHPMSGDRERADACMNTNCEAAEPQSGGGSFYRWDRYKDVGTRADDADACSAR